MNGIWVTVGVAIAGGIGAASRHMVDSAFSPRLRARFPWGTLTVNLTGSFVIGVVTGLALEHPLATVVATGFLGGYTTFSAASADTVRLVAERRYIAALTNGVGVLAAATGLAVCGVLLGRGLA